MTKSPFFSIPMQEIQLLGYLTVDILAHCVRSCRTLTQLEHVLNADASCYALDRELLPTNDDVLRLPSIELVVDEMVSEITREVNRSRSEQMAGKYQHPGSIGSLSPYFRFVSTLQDILSEHSITWEGKGGRFEFDDTIESQLETRVGSSNVLASIFRLVFAKLSFNPDLFPTITKMAIAQAQELEILKQQSKEENTKEKKSTTRSSLLKDNLEETRLKGENDEIIDKRKDVDVVDGGYDDDANVDDMFAALLLEDVVCNRSLCEPNQAPPGTAVELISTAESYPLTSCGKNPVLPKLAFEHDKVFIERLFITQQPYFINVRRIISLLGPQPIPIHLEQITHSVYTQNDLRLFYTFACTTTYNITGFDACSGETFRVFHHGLLQG